MPSDDYAAERTSAYPPMRWPSSGSQMRWSPTDSEDVELPPWSWLCPQPGEGTVPR